MKEKLLILVSGLIFAFGLGISGMTDANKVISFLNVAGEWDPSLAFVMIGAIGLHLLLFRYIIGRKSPLFGDIFHIPSNQNLDLRLIGGSSLFGIGWALGGICPGPGIISGTTLLAENLIFILFLLIGMIVFHAVDRITEKEQ